MLNLRSTARRRLLAYYFTNPDSRLHLRELASRLNIDPANLSKEMRRLETEGLFRSEVSGRQKYFELNIDYPLFEEVRGIVTKTAGIVPTLAAGLAKIAGIDAAWLYGSFASGRPDSASDIDVLIIGEPNDTAVAQATRRLEKQLGREINYTVLSGHEFKRRRSRKDPFLENVLHHKRIVLRDSHGKVQTSHG